MTVNNEIGVIQPIKEIGEMCRARNIKFHTDAAQAVGKIDLDVNDMKIDLMSISGHKLYGPKGRYQVISATLVYMCVVVLGGRIYVSDMLMTKLRYSNELYCHCSSHYIIVCLCCCPGIGALYVRRRPRVRVEPIQSGGGQERNIRSGTVPTPLCVGLGEACRLALQEKEVSYSCIAY